MVHPLSIVGIFSSCQSILFIFRLIFSEFSDVIVAVTLVRMYHPYPIRVKRNVHLIFSCLIIPFLAFNLRPGFIIESLLDCFSLQHSDFEHNSAQEVKDAKFCFFLATRPIIIFITCELGLIRYFSMLIIENGLILSLKRPTGASKAQTPIQNYPYPSVFIRSPQCFRYSSKILF